jgi:hypothetical protein
MFTHRRCFGYWGRLQTVGNELALSTLFCQPPTTAVRRSSTFITIVPELAEVQ